MVQRIIAFLLFVILLPFVCVVYLTLFLGLIENPIFSQERIGLNQQKFTIYKFKSMKNGEITTMGKVIRKLGIDELPQLWNIVLGDMHFVGPRPLTQFDIDRLEWNTTSHKVRWSVKPGITGLAQLSNLCDKEVSWNNDIEYINHRSGSLDRKLIMKSILIPIVGKAKQSRQ